MKMSFFTVNTILHTYLSLLPSEAVKWFVFELKCVTAFGPFGNRKKGDSIWAFASSEN